MLLLVSRFKAGGDHQLPRVGDRFSDVSPGRCLIIQFGHVVGYPCNVLIERRLINLPDMINICTLWMRSIEASRITGHATMSRRYNAKN